MNADIPFSRSADNNKDHILEQLRTCLKDGDRVLEIASGTGQHALHFSAALPNVTWQPSDVDLGTFALAKTIAANQRSNLLSPIVVDVADWPEGAGEFDAIYSANCVHIVGWSKVVDYIGGAANSLRPNGRLILYGPFKYEDQFTTPSNEEFDRFLGRTYAEGGIRDFEAIDQLAEQGGLVFERDVAMPANNQFLTWRKLAVER